MKRQHKDDPTQKPLTNTVGMIMEITPTVSKEAFSCAAAGRKLNWGYLKPPTTKALPKTRSKLLRRPPSSVLCTKSSWQRAKQIPAMMSSVKFPKEAFNSAATAELVLTATCSVANPRSAASGRTASAEVAKIKVLGCWAK